MPVAQKALPANCVFRLGEAERALILRVTSKFFRDQADAEDAAQNAMLMAYRHRENFRGDSLFTTWLYQVAMNAARMHLRSMKPYGRFANEVNHEDLLELLSSPETADRWHDEHEAMKLFGRAIRTLQPAEQELVERLLDDEGSSDIAREKGWNISMTKTRVYRMRQSLKAALLAA